MSNSKAREKKQQPKERGQKMLDHETMKMLHHQAELKLSVALGSHGHGDLGEIKNKHQTIRNQDLVPGTANSLNHYQKARIISITLFERRSSGNDFIHYKTNHSISGTGQ